MTRKHLQIVLFLTIFSHLKTFLVFIMISKRLTSRYYGLIQFVVINMMMMMDPIVISYNIIDSDIVLYLMGMKDKLYSLNCR